MLKSLISAIIVIGLATPCWGSCSKPVTYLTEQTNTPCNGYLFTPEAELENRLKLIDLKYKQEQIANLEKLVANKDAIISNLEEQVSLQKVDYKEFEDLKKYNHTRDSLFFGAGMLATILLFFAVRRM